MVPGDSWRTRLLGEVRQVEASETGSLRIRLSDYPALGTDLGAVRIGTSTVVNNLPRGLFYPILINRAPNKVFHALSSECTHAATVVRVFSKTSNTCSCPLHGSQFAIDGRRLSGPAAAPLRKYETSFDGQDALSILLPDIAFAIDARVVSSTPQGRLSLEFLAFSNLEYEVAYRPNMEAEWQKVPFSTTESGPASLMFLPGTDDFVKVHLDRTTAAGFYQVGIRIKPV